MIVEDEWDNIDVDYDHIDEEILNIDVFHGTHPDFVAYLQTRLIFSPINYSLTYNK